MQLRPLKSEGMLPFKGGAGAWKPHQRCCGEPAPPTGSKVHVRWPGGERAPLTFQHWLSVANTTVWESRSVGTCGWRTVLHCASWVLAKAWQRFTVCASFGKLGLVKRPRTHIKAWLLLNTCRAHGLFFLFFLFLLCRCSSSRSPVLDKSKIFCLKFYLVFSLLFMFAGGKDYFFFISRG